MAVVNEPITPTQGKRIWAAFIIGGLLIASPIVYEFGLKKGEAGFLWLLAVIGAGIILLHVYMWKHRRDKAKRLGTPQSAILPFFLLQDTLILDRPQDTVGEFTSGGVDWLTFALATVGVLALVGGIYLLKMRDQRRTYPEPESPTEEKREHPRRHL